MRDFKIGLFKTYIPLPPNIYSKLYFIEVQLTSQVLKNNIHIEVREYDPKAVDTKWCCRITQTAKRKE
jgi:hypothetical protein